jgi:hypothetical protein
MELTIEELFQESRKLDFEFVKSSEQFLKFFYLMMGRKTCSCPNKPRVVTREALQEANDIYGDFKYTLSEDFKRNLKLKFNTDVLSLKNKDNVIFLSF